MNVAAHMMYTRHQNWCLFCIMDSMWQVHKTHTYQHWIPQHDPVSTSDRLVFIVYKHLLLLWNVDCWLSSIVYCISITNKMFENIVNICHLTKSICWFYIHIPVHCQVLFQWIEVLFYCHYFFSTMFVGYVKYACLMFLWEFNVKQFWSDVHCEWQSDYYLFWPVVPNMWYCAGFLY